MIPLLWIALLWCDLLSASEISTVVTWTFWIVTTDRACQRGQATMMILGKWWRTALILMWAAGLNFDYSVGAALGMT